jgi:CheY-like chemotaxis protein
MHSELFHILLVEDNAADVYLFRKALETAEVNFELTVISDGAEALTFVGREGKYSEHPVPDLAVLDLNLPRKGGDEILEAIHASRYFANVPVVIASSSSSPGEQSRVQQTGCRTVPPEAARSRRVFANGHGFEANTAGRQRRPPAPAV